MTPECFYCTTLLKEREEKREKQVAGTQEIWQPDRGLIIADWLMKYRQHRIKREQIEGLGNKLKCTVLVLQIQYNTVYLRTDLMVFNYDFNKWGIKSYVKKINTAPQASSMSENWKSVVKITVDCFNSAIQNRTTVAGSDLNPDFD